MTDIEKTQKQEQLRSCEYRAPMGDIAFVQADKYMTKNIKLIK